MMMEWSESGFPELGDKVAKGLCPHFKSVINHPQFSEQPEKAAEIVWRMKGNYVASNAILAFSPILGIHYYNILGKVIKNTLLVCDILIPDSRCQAGGVALSVTLAMLIQRDPKHLKKSGEYNINAIISDVFDYASKLLSLDAEVRELQSYMYNSSLKQLQLNEPGKTRYIFKTVGVAMWALKQKDFRKALQEIVMEGGDADANAAAAGAVLGCKMGLDAIPKSWIDSLLHRTWLDSILDEYVHICIHTCVRTYIYIYILTHSQTTVYIYIHTHKHIHIHHHHHHHRLTYLHVLEGGGPRVKYESVV
uniref:Uncharacterized protein n=1 Tax=Octopus bimaculoides TaxID=37653 RepID=A0A0L8FZJ1_OCTBM